jgi:hypothetical protein
MPQLAAVVLAFDTPTQLKVEAVEVFVAVVVVG